MAALFGTDGDERCTDGEDVWFVVNWTGVAARESYVVPSWDPLLIKRTLDRGNYKMDSTPVKKHMVVQYFYVFLNLFLAPSKKNHAVISPLSHVP